ncbi:MAG: phosphoribosylformylglycinamidine cyclo-ligase [Thermoplasmatota archaeon]
MPRKAQKRRAGKRRAPKSLTYAASGVDVVAKDEAAKAMVKAFAFSRPSGGWGAPLGGKGHFAGLVEFGEYALALATDGVGTKLEVANAMEKWDTVGIDCVAMNANDLVCVGAEPLAFVDYLAVEKPDPILARELAKGLDEGARQANVSIVGGETAVLPSLVKGFDLAGTCMGVVRRDRIIDGSRIRDGDVIIGLASSGIHSNGLTLARRAAKSAKVRFTDKIWKGRTLGAELLEPTRMYVKPALAAIAALGDRLHGLANITGSGLLNVPRLNRKVRYVLDAPMPAPRIFDLIAEWGRVETAEMYRTFNMGMGFALVVERSAADAALAALKPFGFDARVVGHVAPGTGIEVPSLGVRFEGAKASFD